jgi:hypothetical protein
MFVESDELLEAHLGSWGKLLREVFGVFSASTATLQYVLRDLETDFFQAAVAQNFESAGTATRARSAELDRDRQRIANQDLLDSIEDRAEDEDLARRVSRIDAASPTINRAVGGYVHEMYGFTAHYGDETVRFGVDKRRPPILPESTIHDLGVGLFERQYTADRIKALDGTSLLRWGEPLVDAFARLAETDDRGRAFAVEIQRPSRSPHSEPLIVFCFDVEISPGVDRVLGEDCKKEDYARAVRARSSGFLPTTLERIWWVHGRGECPPRIRQDLEQTSGQNLGSRPERFRELTRGRDWRAVCQLALNDALARVRSRTEVVARLSEASNRVALAQARDRAILASRAGVDGDQALDLQVLRAVEESVARPVFALESCGAAFITWTKL